MKLIKKLYLYFWYDNYDNSLILKQMEFMNELERWKINYWCWVLNVLLLTVYIIYKIKHFVYIYTYIKIAFLLNVYILLCSKDYSYI